VRECYFIPREHATHWRPDTTFVKRLFFFALTQFPTFEGGVKRRGSRGFRSRRRLGGTWRCHGTIVAFSRLIII
jgi:hypothetical protein